MFEQMASRANDDEWLVHRGRYVNTTLLLESGTTQHLLRIHDGRIESFATGPFVMPRWQFALRAASETWAEFCKPLPPPGYHDLMAMIRYRTLKLEGDQHPFMANLLYFKDLLACARGGASTDTRSGE